MGKAIVLINLGGQIGGAEKRYLTAFKNFKDEDNITLFINKNLADSFNEDFSNQHEKVVILKIDSLFRRKKVQEFIGGFNIKTNKPINRIRKITGRGKTVIKLIIGWLLFSFAIIPHFWKNRFTSVYGVWTGGIWTWPFKYMFGFKFCYAYMDSNYDSLYRSWDRILDSEYWVLKNADVVDCLSPKIAEDLQKLIKFSKKTVLSVTPNSFIDYTNYFPVYPKKRQIVFLARLYPKKNPMLLLQAINLLQNRGQFKKGYKILFVGEGPMKSVMEDYIKDNRISNVEIIGFTLCPFEILQQSLVFVSLQEIDNYPSQSLIEAMACENAIIATDTGCTNLLISPQEGLLIDKDVEKTASAIGFLMNNPEICESMGKSARKKVIHIHTVERFIDYFKTITN